MSDTTTVSRIDAMTVYRILIETSLGDIEIDHPRHFSYVDQADLYTGPTTTLEWHGQEGASLKEPVIELDPEMEVDCE